MENVLRTYDLGKKKLIIYRDTEPPDPREEYDHFGTMYCWHRRVLLGDKHDIKEPSGLNPHDYPACLPLYLYEHSGMTMQTRPFHCPFDSAQVGWIVAKAEDIKKQFGSLSMEAIKQAETALESEVREYDCYLTGQVYGFVLEDEEGNQVDAVGSFYGENPLTNGMVDHLGKEDAEALVDLHTVANTFKQSILPG